MLTCALCNGQRASSRIRSRYTVLAITSLSVSRCHMHFYNFAGIIYQDAVTDKYCVLSWEINVFGRANLFCIMIFGEKTIRSSN